MIKTLLLLLNAGKLGKVLLTSGTMILSVFAYALMFGFPYAIGFVLLIFVHEMGHYIAARQEGLEAGAPTFIPFVGAWIQLKEQPMNVATEAYIAIAGPVAGTLGALVCYYMARVEESTLLLALAYSGFMINLFNLIPLPPLDGGRIVSILSPKIWLIGVPLLLGLFFWRPSPMLILILILALPNIWSAVRGLFGRKNEDDEDIHPPGYHEAPMELRLQYGAWYLGLAGFLAIMCYELHKMLPRASL